MLTAAACMRCHRLSTQLSTGLLRLCPACPVLPACGEGQHQYRAADGEGRWICLNCGATLGSESLIIKETTN
jgi:hypothetical protein